jgi:hypothetical protein
MLQEINKSNLPKTIVAFSQIDQLVQNLWRPKIDINLESYR